MCKNIFFQSEVEETYQKQFLNEQKNCKNYYSKKYQKCKKKIYDNFIGNRYQGEAKDNFRTLGQSDQAQTMQLNFM